MQRRALLTAGATALVALAACGGTARYAEVTFRNDLPRPVQLALCIRSSCLVLRWAIGLDPGAEATEQLPEDGRTRRFLVYGSVDRVYGCLAVRPVTSTVRLSAAHGCGGRP